MIKIITDSTSYLPPEVIQKYNILIVPLKVQFGTESYDEITDLSNYDFYQRLTSSRYFPTTSQPPAGEFKDACQKILTQNIETQILILTVSSKLSGTYNSAMTAVRQLPGANITVFDSLSVAMGLGMMVITAAQMAARGHSLAEIMPHLEQMRREISIILVVDSLEYLKRGGRIGAAAAFLGTLVDTKPIFAIVEGQLQLLARVRTKKKAINRLLTELGHKLSTPDQPVQAGVMHVSAPAEAEKVAKMIQTHFNVSYFFISELGPVIGAHVGPGMLGAGIYPQLQ